MRLNLLCCALALLLGLALPAAAQIEAGACPPASVRLQPVAATHKSPPYPALSQQMGEQGTSTLKVVIDPGSGSVSDVSVYRSSGSLRLDDAAALYVKQNWQWAVTETGCGPAPVTTLVSIVWNLREPSIPWGAEVTMADSDFPAGARARQEQGTSMVQVLLTETGSVALVRIFTSSGYPDLDAKALNVAKARSWQAAQMDGHGVKSVVLLLVHWPVSK